MVSRGKNIERAFELVVYRLGDTFSSGQDFSTPFLIRINDFNNNNNDNSSYIYVSP